MKKIFFLFLAMIAISAVGCSDDNDDNAQNELLEGTFWVYQETSGSSLWIEAIEFQSDDKCVYVYLEKFGSTTTDQGEAAGTYSYVPPTVTCKVSMDGETATMRLSVNGDKMTDERGVVFEKQ